MSGAGRRGAGHAHMGHIGTTTIGNVANYTRGIGAKGTRQTGRPRRTPGYQTTGATYSIEQQQPETWRAKSWFVCPTRTTHGEVSGVAAWSVILTGAGMRRKCGALMLPTPTSKVSFDTRPR